MFNNFWFWLGLAYAVLAFWSAIQWTMAILRIFLASERKSPVLKVIVAFFLILFVAVYPFVVLFLIFSKEAARETAEATPIFGWFVKRRYHRIAREAAERGQRVFEKKLEEIHRIDKENERLAETRRQWFKVNRPKLYFNTVSGVTAVLRPADYEAVKVETAKARTNELWTNNTLKPARKTFVFITRTGEQLFQANGRDFERYSHVAGWLSDLHELCKKVNVELIRSEDIFVPWVNETLVAFADQRTLIDGCGGFGTTAELIDKQAPSELQHLLYPKSVL